VFCVKYIRDSKFKQDHIEPTAVTSSGVMIQYGSIYRNETSRKQGLQRMEYVQLTYNITDCVCDVCTF